MPTLTADGYPMQPTISVPAAWSTPTAGYDARAFGVVIVTVTTAATTAYTPQWSPDQTNWYAVSGIDGNNNVLSSLGTTFTGPVRFAGNGYFRLNGGTGGVFQIGGGQ